MFVSALRYFLARPYYLALLIILILVLWMLSAPLASQENTKPNTTQQTPLPKVQTTHFTPQRVFKELTLYAKSAANSHADISAEVAGKVIKVAVEKGQYVKAGSNLVNIEPSERPERLAQAQAQLIESELNYRAAKSLNAKGLQGDIYVAEIKSAYLAAKTQVKQLKLELKRTNISAPFAGILQQQHVQLGDYLKIGDSIFSIENTDPIVIRGDVTEHYITQLKVGQKVTARLVAGENITGKLTYIAALADSQSSTFAIEAEFANPDLRIFSGMSAKLTIPLYPVNAIYVSPSVLAMDSAGNLGVKVVENDVVQFKAAQLLEADNDGAWLSGFDKPVDIITLGQGFVKPGAKVQAMASEE